MEFGIEKMHHASNEKRENDHMTEGIETTESRKDQNARRKGKITNILEILETDHHQTSEDERKN